MEDEADEPPADLDVVPEALPEEAEEAEACARADAAPSATTAITTLKRAAVHRLVICIRTLPPRKPLPARQRGWAESLRRCVSGPFLRGRQYTGRKRELKRPLRASRECGNLTE